MSLCGANARQEFIDPEWFRDIIVGAEIERFDLGAFILTTRQDNDRQGFAAIPDLTDDIEAIHVGQTEVEDYEIGGVSFDHVERGAGVRCVLDDIALALQARPQKAKDCRLVIDDENAKQTPGHDETSPVNHGVTGTGSLMVKTAPGWSIRLAAVIEPPMDSTKPRQMASPSPVPARCRSERRTR